MKKAIYIFTAVLALVSNAASASTASGYVVRVEGRADNSCRYVSLRTADGGLLMLRIASGAGSEGVMAVAMAALTSHTQVEVEYASASMCGGNELAIGTIALLSS